MKKMTLSLLAAAFMTFSGPTLLRGAETPITPVHIATTSDAAAANKMLNRLSEIQAMDLKNLAKADKKQLRKEVRAIRHDLKALSGGVYLSATAIIIILLVLILLT